MKRPAHAVVPATLALSNKPAARAFHNAAILCLLLVAKVSWAQQSTPQETPQQELQRLKQAVEQSQAQVEASQQQLIELKKSLAALELRLARDGQTNSASAPQLTASPASPPPAQVDDLHERQAMQETQIATLDQSKVESESKYPVKIDGLLLFNGFVNTSQVDVASAPSLAIAGGGSTGASLRQTVLGIDARGPRLAGATSHADLRVDFFGSATGSTGQSSYTDVGGLLRLRTAHATLDWTHTQAFIELDRPIVSPTSPTSLVAVAEPALAWSGSLWVWSPQIGFTQTLALGASSHLALEAALIDVPDPPLAPGATSTNTVSEAEHSRWPGSEFHLGLAGKENGAGPAIGIGGYFSPHETAGGLGYNAWAATLDLNLPLAMGFEISGSLYRGAALGGLGGGTYKDYLYAEGKALALDDVGGWAQLKKHAGPRLEFNGAFGMDNAFSSQLREYVSYSSTGYQNLARNQTFFANAIYSPSAYLLFSLEVRHIATTPVTGAPANSNVVGIAAGYKF